MSIYEEQAETLSLFIEFNLFFTVNVMGVNIIHDNIQEDSQILT